MNTDEYACLLWRTWTKRSSGREAPSRVLLRLFRLHASFFDLTLEYSRLSALALPSSRILCISLVILRTYAWLGPLPCAFTTGQHRLVIIRPSPPSDAFDADEQCFSSISWIRLGLGLACYRISTDDRLRLPPKFFFLSLSRIFFALLSCISFVVFCTRRFAFRTLLSLLFILDIFVLIFFPCFSKKKKKEKPISSHLLCSSFCHLIAIIRYETHMVPFSKHTGQRSLCIRTQTHTQTHTSMISFLVSCIDSSIHASHNPIRCFFTLLMLCITYVCND